MSGNWDKNGDPYAVRVEFCKCETSFLLSSFAQGKPLKEIMNGIFNMAFNKTSKLDANCNPNETPLSRATSKLLNTDKIIDNAINSNISNTSNSPENNICIGEKGMEKTLCYIEQEKNIFTDAKAKADPYRCLDSAEYSIIPKDIYDCIKEVDVQKKVTYESITPLLEKYNNTVYRDTIYYWLSKNYNDERYCNLIKNDSANAVIVKNCNAYFGN